MRGRLAGLSCAAALCLGGCGSSQSAPRARTAPPAAPDSHNPIHPIAVGERVTPFQVVTLAGDTIDSADLVGKRPWVVLFFASWCDVCDMELPVVHRALAEAGAGVLAFGVSLDDAATWDRVAGFVRRENMRYPIVRGERFMHFARSYDPTGQVPAVAVVGRDGVLVDYLVGYSHTYPGRLRRALSAAAR